MYSEITKNFDDIIDRATVRYISQLFIRYFLRLLLLFASAIILYILVISTSNDAVQYIQLIKNYSDKDFLRSFINMQFQNRGEPGTYFLLWLVTLYYRADLAFYLVSLLSLSIKNYIFFRYLHYASLAFIGYVLIFVHILDANQLREAFAVCFVFYALFIEPKNKYTYLLLAGAGIIFHYSALLILSLYFIRAPIIGLISMIVFVLMGDILVTYNDFFSFASIWTGKVKGQVNLTSSLFIVQTTISIAAISVWKILTPAQKRGAYFNTIGVLIYLLFTDYPIIAHRVRELTQLGIFPLLFFDKQKLTYVRIIWGGGFLYYIIYNLYWIIEEINSKYNVF